MRYLIAATLIVAGLIHLLPVVGVAGPDRLTSLYGITIAGADAEILMRHRAVLLGLVGGLMVFAAFKPALQPAAFAVGLLSAGTFLFLAWSVGGHNAALSQVVAADIVALACLILGAAIHAYMAIRRLG